MAITLNTQSQAASVCNMAQGQVTTDAGGAGADTIFSPGFAPRYVQLVDRTNRITLEWYEGMAANSAIRTVAAGTRTLDVASGITVGSVSNPNSGPALGQFMIKAADLGASASFSWRAHG